jgi:hypothetical protein
MVRFGEEPLSIERRPRDGFRPAVIEVLGGLFEGEIASVNRHLAAAPVLVVWDEEAVVTAFFQLTPSLVLRVQDDDATVSLELRRQTANELVESLRDEHAFQSVIGPDPFGVPVDDDGAVLPNERPRSRKPLGRRLR